MYHRYFGLEEAPFSIAVNPKYLFMSTLHRDALAHLLYGVGAGGGFILLTGEVGTGKTTINRALMQQLPEETDIAVILNPALNADELLATVCDELHVDYDRENYTLKSLTDTLHSFLLDNHSRGRNTVLLIDEAQHLQFDVLEQIRLLTNLETNTRKLLQIVLVGQPELAAILSRPELRQLNQRITARFELKALDRDGTDAYIRHRLQVAGLPASQDLFPAPVIREIHRLTGGIPRVINVLCDRVLLGAYGHNRSRIDMKIVRQAASEVFGETGASRPREEQRFALVGALFLGIVIAAAVYWRWNTDTVVTMRAPASTVSREALPAAPPALPPPREVSTPELAEIAPPKPDADEAMMALPLQESVAQPESIPSTEPETPGVQTAEPGSAEVASVGAVLTEAEPAAEETDALETDAVEANTVETDRSSPFYPRRWLALSQLARTLIGRSLGDCRTLAERGLRCEERSVATWDELLVYNQPAVLSLVTAERFSSHVVLMGVSGDQALLMHDDTEHTMPLAELGKLWQGDFMFLWQPPPGYSAPVSRGASGEVVTWLAQAFAELDGQSTALATNYFNEDLDQRVRLFQREYQLLDDGVVGVRTLLKLQERQGAASTLLRTQAAVLSPEGH